MRLLVAGLVLVALAVGCQSTAGDVETFAERVGIKVGVAHVRGCDYILALGPGGNVPAIVHAGDCANLLGHSTRNGFK